jgi:hypothetical protein
MITADQYLALATSEHRQQPNFAAFVEAMVQGVVDGINALLSFPTVFDLDQASGQQLDVLGQWIGLPRSVNVLIANFYFSFDTPGLGWDQGQIQSSTNPNAGVIVMDDPTYRTMLRVKIACNEWDGSLGDANDALQAIFPDLSVQIKDNFNMSESVIISGTPQSVLLQELITIGYIQFKPMGVAIV